MTAIVGRVGSWPSAASARRMVGCWSISAQIAIDASWSRSGCARIARSPVCARCEGGLDGSRGGEGEGLIRDLTTALLAMQAQDRGCCRPHLDRSKDSRGGHRRPVVASRRSRRGAAGVGDLDFRARLARARRGPPGHRPAHAVGVVTRSISYPDPHRHPRHFRRGVRRAPRIPRAGGLAVSARGLPGSRPGRIPSTSDGLAGRRSATSRRLSPFGARNSRPSRLGRRGASAGAAATARSGAADRRGPRAGFRAAKGRRANRPGGRPTIKREPCPVLRREFRRLRRSSGAFPALKRERHQAFTSAFRIMSDNATLSDIPTPRQAGRITRQMSVTKRRRRIHHGPGDSRRSRLARRPHCRPAGATCRAAPASACATKRTSTKTPEQQAFPPPAPIPAWARASGRAGQGDPLFAAGAGLALLDAFLRADPPAAGALRARLALQSAAACRKDPAPQRRRSRAARPPLRRRRPARARGDPVVAVARCAPAGRPASIPAGFSTRRRGSTWLWTRTASQSSLKACAGEGDPVSAAAKAAALAFSTLPDAPAADAEIFALWAFDMVIAHPAALAAARAADRHENSGSRPCACRAQLDGQGRATQLGQTPPPARSRSPPPPPSTSPPIFPAAPNPHRRRAQTARRNRPRKSSTSCSPKIASRPPKPPATRR